VPDRVARLRALGNALVPQIPELLGRTILAASAGADAGDLEPRVEEAAE
jgi:hypothetical protein